MKKSILLLAITILTLSENAFADQAATLTCTGKNIILEVKSPYLGENSKATQELFVLKSRKSNSNETTYTAYFLDISYDIGRGGVTYISGKNAVGGMFDLVTNFPQDENNGTTVRQVSHGTLTYNHGPLKGKETVDCVTE
jgi:hypothetical protein